MFNETFLASIPDDLVHGALHIISDYNIYYKKNSSMPVLPRYAQFLEYWSLLRAFLKKHNHPFIELDPNLSEIDMISQIEKKFKHYENEFNSQTARDYILKTYDRFDTLFKNTFSYEFTDGDLDRIQQLINELRDHVTKSELFTAEHQQRILKRLEKLQSELHKRVSDLDKFWGLIGDAGVAIGKFGTDAKPFVDRIREIADIVWRTQSKAEELESGFKIPFLTATKDSE